MTLRNLKQQNMGVTESNCVSGGVPAIADGLNGKPQMFEPTLPGMTVGRICAARPNELLVDFPASTLGDLVSPRSLVPITEAETGRDVALMFEDGDPSRPIVVGFFQSTYTDGSADRKVKVNGDSLVLSAHNEVVIQCGKASITLTSAGKVLIQGEYLLTRSTGVNKIRGGSIQLN